MRGVAPANRCLLPFQSANPASESSQVTIPRLYLVSHILDQEINWTSRWYCQVLALNPKPPDLRPNLFPEAAQSIINLMRLKLDYLFLKRDANLTKSGSSVLEI